MELVGVLICCLVLGWNAIFDWIHGSLWWCDMCLDATCSDVEYPCDLKLCCWLFWVHGMLLLVPWGILMLLCSDLKLCYCSSLLVWTELMLLIWSYATVLHYCCFARSFWIWMSIPVVLHEWNLLMLYMCILVGQLLTYWLWFLGANCNIAGVWWIMMLTMLFM